MKILIATAFSALLLGTALTPAMADDQPSTDPARGGGKLSNEWRGKLGEKAGGPQNGR